MINSVTISVAEYDMLRKEAEQVQRLASIKEPEITLIPERKTISP